MAAKRLHWVCNTCMKHVAKDPSPPFVTHKLKTGHRDVIKSMFFVVGGAHRRLGVSASALQKEIEDYKVNEEMVKINWHMVCRPKSEYVGEDVRFICGDGVALHAFPAKYDCDTSLASSVGGMAQCVALGLCET